MRLLDRVAKIHLTSRLRCASSSASTIVSLILFAAFTLHSSANADAQPTPQFIAAQSSVSTTTSLNYPYRVATDSKGSVYISDTQNNRVIKETLSGGVYTETVVQTGLSTPYGVAVDSSGAVYIVDNGNVRIVKDTPVNGGYEESVITTSALTYPTGIAVDSSGNVYITDTGHGRVLKETPSGGSYTESVVSSSGLPQPTGVTVDSSGNLFVSDIDAQAIFEETYSAGSYTQSTVPTSGLNYPYDVDVDGNGNLYIADFANDRIVKETYIEPGSYTQSVYPTANLTGPLGVATDVTGNLYIADTFGFEIKLETLAGGNFGPVNVGSSGGPLYALFQFSGKADDMSTTPIGSITIGTQGTAQLDYADAGSSSCATSVQYHVGDFCGVSANFSPKYPGPRYGAVSLSGTGFSVTGYFSGLAEAPQINFVPGAVSIVAGTSDPFDLSNPFAAAVDAAGNVYIADYNSNAVYKEALSNGAYTQTTIATGLNNPEDVAVDGAGNVYIVDSGNNQVLLETFNGSGYTQSTVAGSLDFPTGIAVDGLGNVYVSSFGDGAVYLETLVSGSYTQSTVTSGLNEPRKIAIDGSGNVYIANTGASQVVMERWTGSGYTQTTIGSGMLYPYGVAVDASGSVWVADTVNHRILREALSGSTYTQYPLYPGATVYGITVGGDGTLYIPDAETAAVYALNLTQPGSLSFATTYVGSVSSDSPQSQTVINSGNVPLTLAASNTAANPSLPTGFDLNNATTCPQAPVSGSQVTIAAGIQCAYAVDFAPVAAGSISGSMTITDNSLNITPVTQEESLSGQALLPFAKFAFTGLPLTLAAGTAQSFVLTAENPSGARINSGYSGTALLTSSDPSAIFSLTSGGAAITSYTFTSGDSGAKTLYVTFKTAGSSTVTADDTSAGVSNVSGGVLVTAATAANLSAISTTTSSAIIGGVQNFLEVQVSDAYSNPVSGVTVTYAAPSSGPSAVLTSTAVQTDSNGYAQIVAYANGIAGGQYTVTASVSGLSGSPVSYTMTNLVDSTTSALTASPATTAVYGTAITLTATVTPDIPAEPDLIGRLARGKAVGKRSSALPSMIPLGPAIGPPTGTVSFYDTVNSISRLLGSSTVGGNSGTSPNLRSYGTGVTETSGTASFSIVAPLGGSHSYTAVYVGDANFTTSSTVASPYTITKAPATITGPSKQPVPLTAATASSIPITITGSSTGTDIQTPTGSVNYTLLNSANATIASGTASVIPGATNSAASIPTPGDLVSGAYTLNLSYAGDGNYGSGSASVTLAVVKAEPVIHWTPASSIVYGTSLNAILTATASFNSASIIGTFVYTATPTVGSSQTVTAASLLDGGSYELAVIFTPTDSASYSTATGTVSLTVSPGSTQIALLSSLNPAFYSNPVSFTATVSSTTETPTGSVGFYDGGSLLGTVSLTAGSAVFSSATLAIATHTITAVYVGNANFATVTSSALSEVVVDFGLTLTGGGSGGSSGSATASPGGQATYNFTIAPQAGTKFPGPVTLTVSGLPTGATATFTPQVLSANAGSTPVSLVIQLPTATAMNSSPGRDLRTNSPLISSSRKALGGGPLVALAILLLPFSSRLRGAARCLRHRTWIALLILLGGASLLSLSGCGGKPSGFFGTAPQTYTLTITATSGTLSHSTTVTLTVE